MKLPRWILPGFRKLGPKVVFTSSGLVLPRTLSRLVMHRPLSNFGFSCLKPRQQQLFPSYEWASECATRNGLSWPALKAALKQELEKAVVAAHPSGRQATEFRMPNSGKAKGV